MVFDEHHYINTSIQELGKRVSALEALTRSAAPPLDPTPEPATISDEDVREDIADIIDKLAKADHTYIHSELRLSIAANAIEYCRTKLAPSRPALSEEEIVSVIRAHSRPSYWGSRDGYISTSGGGVDAVGAARAILAAGLVERAAEVKDVAPKILALIREYPDRFAKQVTVKGICRELWQEALDLCASLGMRDGSEDGPCASACTSPATPKQASGDPAVDRQAAPSVPAGEQKPVAWIIPGDDNADDKGFIDAMAWQEGEFSKPLYAAPPTPQKPSDDVVALRKAANAVITAYKNRNGFQGASAFHTAISRLDLILAQATTP